MINKILIWLALAGSLIYLFIDWKISLILFFIFIPIIINRNKDLLKRKTFLSGIVFIYFIYIWYKWNFLTAIPIFIGLIFFEFLFGKYFSKSWIEFISITNSIEEKEVENVMKTLSIKDFLLLPLELTRWIGVLLQIWAYISIGVSYTTHDYFFGISLFVIGEIFYIFHDITTSYVIRNRYNKYFKKNKKEK